MTEDLWTIIGRLRRSPVIVEVRDPDTGATVKVTLTEQAFGDALRVMLYDIDQARKVPLLLHQAVGGDYRPFAQLGLESSRGQRAAFRLGLLLSVTCGEDVWRIRPGEVERETRGSFIGPYRVLGQMAACREWPRSQVPARYYRPFRSNVPAILVSGKYDPATPPRWGDEARRSLPNSLHLIVPRGHASFDACLREVATQLFDTADIHRVDTSCVKRMEAPPFALPPGR